MVFTFLKARGLGVGSSLVEEDKLDLAKELEEKAKKAGVEIILPSDVILADAFAADAKTQVCVCVCVRLYVVSGPLCAVRLFSLA